MKKLLASMIMLTLAAGCGSSEHNDGYKQGQERIWTGRKTDPSGGILERIGEQIQPYDVRPNKSTEWNRGYVKGQEDAINNR